MVSPGPGAPPARVHERFVLSMLTLVFTLSYVDRGLITLLLQPIKEDLHLSDTQLGFVTGIAFGLFYAILGVPIARLADRGNRVNLTSVAICLWGLTVMSYVFVTGFLQLAGARIAAAVGEAGCMPSTYSLMGDYFPEPSERARAMSIYWLASPLSALVSYVGGGWLNQHYGWRATFLMMGIPAVIIAVLIKLTLSEPRASAHYTYRDEPRAPRILSVWLLLWNTRATRHLCVAIILLFTLGLGLGPWYAAFMMRSHGMSTAQVGTWFGLIAGFGGMTGILLGGYISSRILPIGHEVLQMRVTAVVAGLLFPCFILFLLLPGRTLTLMAMVALQVVFNFYLGPAFALLQRLVDDQARATSLAVVMLLANLIGMGLGPQVVGILSDSLMPTLGSESLRYAMLMMSSIALWAAYHLWQAGATVDKDLAEVASRTYA